MATGNTTTNQIGLSFTNFPVLEINPKDVFGSWKTFIKKFSLTLKYQVIAAGTTTSTATPPVTSNNFTEDMKVLALLNSVGDEGLRILESQGIDLDADDLVYADVLGALKNHYGREESLNIRVHKFVHAQQLSGEDSRDYLRRVEHLSRSVSVFKTGDHTKLNDVTDPAQVTAANRLGEQVREILALTAVVNGLRDTKLRRELMAKDNLNWELLCKILTARSSADDSNNKLDKPINQRDTLISPDNIKQEVSYSRFRDHSRNRSFSRDRFRGRSNSRNRYSRYDSRDRSSRYSGYNSGERHTRNYSRERFSSRDRDSRRSGSGERYSNRQYSRDQNSKRDSSRDRNSMADSNNDKTGCFYCKSPSHRIRDCKKVTYINCNAKGHTAIDCKKGDSRSGAKSVRDIQSDGPRSLRSRSPSPYPDRGRADIPSHFINRIKIDPRTIGFADDA